MTNDMTFQFFESQLIVAKPIPQDTESIRLSILLNNVTLKKRPPRRC
jgi:hypothetical protein